MTKYTSSWSTSLVIASVVIVLFLAGISISPYFFAEKNTPLAWIALLPLLVVLGCALFIVRDITITRDEILIRRPLWTTRLPRTGLLSAEFEPGVMRKSLRVCGIGGLFSFTGFHWSRRLGFYRAYVTDLKRTVLLRYEGRTVVLSPDRAEEFVRELME